MRKNFNLLSVTLLLCLLICFSKLIKGEYIFVSNENSDTVTILDKQNKNVIKILLYMVIQLKHFSKQYMQNIQILEYKNFD